SAAGHAHLPDPGPLRAVPAGGDVSARLGPVSRRPQGSTRSPTGPLSPRGGRLAHRPPFPRGGGGENASPGARGGGRRRAGRASFAPGGVPRGDDIPIRRGDRVRGPGRSARRFSAAGAVPHPGPTRGNGNISLARQSGSDLQSGTVT